jgi:hypothetical protein
MPVRHQQRPAPLQRDADLHARETPMPALDDPLHRTRHATSFDEVDDGGVARCLCA